MSHPVESLSLSERHLETPTLPHLSHCHHSPVQPRGTSSMLAGTVPQKLQDEHSGGSQLHFLPFWIFSIYESCAWSLVHCGLNFLYQKFSGVHSLFRNQEIRKIRMQENSRNPFTKETWSTEYIGISGKNRSFSLSSHLCDSFITLTMICGHRTHDTCPTEMSA